MKANQKRQGHYLGGRVPFGCKSVSDGAFEPVPAEQATIKAVVELRQSGKSPRAISRDRE